MNILYVTSEAVPFCKTGGLADVAGSLPQSLAANGDRVSVILPLYQSVADAWRDRLHFERYTYVRLAWRSLYCGLFSYERQGVTWYFVDNEQYFKRPELYGYYDDGERFAFFCRAVTELLPLHFLLHFLPLPDRYRIPEDPDFLPYVPDPALLPAHYTSVCAESGSSSLLPERNGSYLAQYYMPSSQLRSEMFRFHRKDPPGSGLSSTEST